MKKPITILAVLLLLSTTTFAAEYPSQVSYSMNNGIFEVRKTYELPVDQEPSMQAKQSFEQDGYSFTLTDLLRQELPEQQSKEYTETVTVSSESKELTAILPLLTATVLTTTPALALEYTEADAAAGSFGKPTSVEPVTVVGGSNIYETDVSKNAAYIPPAFGSPMADMPGSGERLTPNLLTGGYLESGTASSGTTGTATVMPPAAETPSNSGTTWSSGYTAVTNSLYYKDGSLGTLSAPAIGLSAKIYQGTDNAAMRKGAGHFTETSIWDGNVAFAGHNRGSSNYFGKIHTLKNGNTIKLTTRLGTRTYSVYSVRKISVNDVSVLNPTTDNVVTLVTCVMNQPQYRWCVQARQK